MTKLDHEFESIKIAIVSQAGKVINSYVNYLIQLEKKQKIPGEPTQTISTGYAPEMIQKHLHFVQRGRILVRCGSALRYRCPPWAFPP